MAESKRSTEWEFDFNELILEKELGKGSFKKGRISHRAGAYGTVYKAQWRHRNVAGNNGS